MSAQAKGLAVWLLGAAAVAALAFTGCDQSPAQAGETAAPTEPDTTPAPPPPKAAQADTSPQPPPAPKPQPPPANPLNLELDPISGVGVASPRIQIEASETVTRDILDAGYTNNGNVLAALVRPGNLIIETRDHGQTWTLQPRLEETLTEFEVGNKLWFGLGELDYDGIPRKLKRSYHAGQKWKDRPTREELIGKELRLLRMDGRMLYFAFDEELAVSRDRGETWGFTDPRLGRPLTALHIADNERLWSGSDEGIISRSTGRRREPYKRLDLPREVGPIQGFATHPEGPTFAVTLHGLFQLDEEEAWQRVEPIGHRALHGAKYLDKDLIVAFGPSARVLVSKDQGATWTDATPLIVHTLGLEPLDVLEVQWRFVEPVPNGFILFGDHGSILRIKL